MGLLLRQEVLPFLLGLSTGLLVPFGCWVAVEILKTWRGRARVLNLSDPWPRANVRGVRQKAGVL